MKRYKNKNDTGQGWPKGLICIDAPGNGLPTQIWNMNPLVFLDKNTPASFLSRTFLGQLNAILMNALSFAWRNTYFQKCKLDARANLISNTKCPFKPKHLLSLSSNTGGHYLLVTVYQAVYLDLRTGIWYLWCACVSRSRLNSCRTLDLLHKSWSLQSGR